MSRAVSLSKAIAGVATLGVGGPGESGSFVDVDVLGDCDRLGRRPGGDAQWVEQFLPGVVEHAAAGGLRQDGREQM